MKNLWIVGSLALVSLSCRREEEISVKPPASDHKPSHTSSHAAAEEPTPETADSKATKTKERPANEEKKIWVAEPVADQPGFVKSPFSGKIIDVRGIPAGRLVADPTFPASEMKHFRVPEMPEDPDEELKRNAPVARSMPGQQGFIFSSHDNKIIDASGMAPGTVFQDPSSPAGEKRYIKTPGEPTEILDPSIQIDPDGNAVEDP